ncbi:MAG: sporulation initiation factor Spo0A C-terminal domain-containing protein [Huintestinicola sp.]
MSQCKKVVVAEDKNRPGISVAETVRDLGFDAVSVPVDRLSIIRWILTDVPGVVIVENELYSPSDIFRLMKMCENVKEKPVFIITSSYSDPTAERAYSERNDVFFLLRPFDSEVLEDILTAYCFGTTGANGTRHYDPKVCGHEDMHLPSAWSEQPKNTPAAYSNDVERTVTEVIQKIGIPANVKGYRYLRNAVMLALDDMSILDSVTKQLYPTVAMNNRTTPTRVERAIRHAITTAWDRGDGDVEFIEKRLGCKINFSGMRPTNSELIALISDCLRLTICK